MIFRIEPDNFRPIFEIVSCFIEKDGKYLFLRRLEHKSEGGKWGVPAGKIEGRETKEAALLREIGEETGYDLSKNRPKYYGKVFVRYPEKDFVYHMASAKIETKSMPVINTDEHCEFVWVTPGEALQLDLIKDEDACIKLFFDL
jgi:8-oxo-dGTP pyrophosphatase MutT (NUDIX family)